jgi:hypothetical protein
MTPVCAAAPVIANTHLAFKLEAASIRRLRIIQGAKRQAIKWEALLSRIMPSAPMMLAPPIRAVTPMAIFRLRFRLEVAGAIGRRLRIVVAAVIERRGVDRETRSGPVRRAEPVPATMVMMMAAAVVMAAFLKFFALSGVCIRERLRTFAAVFERHRLEIQFARHGRTPANGVAC